MLIKKYIAMILVLISISYLIILFIHTPEFIPEIPEVRKETLTLLPYVEGRYIQIPNEPFGLNAKNKRNTDGVVMVYATIYYNLSTPFARYYHPYTIPDSLLDSYKKIYGCPINTVCNITDTKKIECDTVLNIVQEQNIKSLLSADEGCSLLKSCGFEEKIKKKRACLFFYNENKLT